jgi:hypothetical protein
MMQIVIKSTSPGVDIEAWQSAVQRQSQVFIGIPQPIEQLIQYLVRHPRCVMLSVMCPTAHPGDHARRCGELLQPARHSASSEVCVHSVAAMWFPWVWDVVWLNECTASRKSAFLMRAPRLVRMYVALSLAHPAQNDKVSVRGVRADSTVPVTSAVGD